MLPEFLKGKLSLDEWKILIALHLVRFKAYNQTRMSRLLGKIALAPRGLFFLLLFYIPAAATGGGVVGSGSLFSKSHISYRRTLDSEIVKKISEKKGV